MKKKVLITTVLMFFLVAVAALSAAPQAQGEVKVILKGAPALTAGTRVEYEFDMVRSNYDKEMTVKYDPENPLVVTLPAGTYELDVSYKIGRTEYDSIDKIFKVTEGETVTITVDQFRIDR